MFKMFRRFEESNNDGSGAGSGGSSGGDDEIQAKISAAVDAAVAGLKLKNGELIGEQKRLKETLKSFDGIDPEKVRTMLSRLENDDEAKLLAEGKMDEVIQRRTAKRDADWQTKLDAQVAATEAEKARSGKFLGRVLDEQIRAAVNGKVHEKAVEDSLFRARMIFTLDDNGNAVQLQDGQPVLGKDGKTAFTPAEWIESMRDSAPHWFPATGSGSGSQQSHGSGGKKTITRAQFDAQDAHAKKATIAAKVEIID